MDDVAALFRKEAREARQTRLEGEVIIGRSMRAEVVVLFVIVGVVLAIAWLVTGTYSRTEDVKGILATDREAAKIVALHAGVVTKLMVREGQVVRQGQQLAVLQVDQSYSAHGRASDESLAAILTQERLSRQQVAVAHARGESERAALQSTIRSAAAQYGQLQEQVESQKRIIASSQAILARYTPVAERGFISKSEMDRREQDLLIAEQQLQRLEQQKTADLADRQKAEADLSHTYAEENSEAVTASSAAQGFVAQEAQVRGQQYYVLAAPSDGIVTGVQVGVGRTVDASLPIMTVLPIVSTLHAALYAPSRAIGFVHVGEKVRLRYDAFPYERFGSFDGVISSVSRTSLDPRQLDVPLQVQEPVFRVTVRPSRQTLAGFGTAMPLQPGMTLSARIVLEERSFAGWLLDPLRALGRRDL